MHTRVMSLVWPLSGASQSFSIKFLISLWTPVTVVALLHVYFLPDCEVSLNDDTRQHAHVHWSETLKKHKLWSDCSDSSHIARDLIWAWSKWPRSYEKSRIWFVHTSKKKIRCESLGGKNQIWATFACNVNTATAFCFIVLSMFVTSIEILKINQL